MKTKLTLLDWMHAHPILCVLYTYLFTGMSISAGLNEHWRRPILIAFLIVVVIMAFTIFRGLKRMDAKPSPWNKLISIILIAAMTLAPVRTARAIAAIGVAVVVVCAGGYCTYRVIKLCQKKFPKDNTNAPPAELWSMGQDEVGASANFSTPGSCIDGDSDQLTPWDGDTHYIADIKGMVGYGGEITVSIEASKDDGDRSETFEEFKADVAKHGLVVTGTGDGSQYFSRNRIPCGPESVPISFDPITHAVVHAGFVGHQRNVSIERSQDMQLWFPFLSIKANYGTGFLVQDLTRQGQMFYRVTMTEDK